MRKATIFSDAAFAIAQPLQNSIHGRTLIDEDFLREIGVTNFEKYRCDPAIEPPRMMPKVFPSLLVEEESQVLLKSKL